MREKIEEYEERERDMQSQLKTSQQEVEELKVRLSCLSDAVVEGMSIQEQEQMKAQYPDDYVVLMWMCFNYLDQSAVEGTYGEVSADLSFCYNSCRTAYMNQDTEDENMETLIEIMDELE